ncbi:MAG: hypothetical protein CMP49_06035 [Flavobacteriales bacterium]|jgi:hypothetical protein|nr:hypothetical protein [Flavobacteriales bacterium]|tara:strand:- start:6 stop:956 length:951 start_codon:yes stop_codon:yes gene_type:complete
MSIYKYIFICFLVIVSCTKEIEITLPNSGADLVVNGYIENGEPVKILLTRSLPYFDPVNDEQITGSYINDAIITITNSLGESEVLSNNIGLTDTWYHNYSGSAILGQEEMTYVVNITKGDTILTAQTTIPKLAPVTIDSLRFLYRADDSAYCYMLGHLFEPDTIGNCYRIFSKTKPIWGSSFDNNQDGYDDLYMSMLDQDGNYNDEYTNGWEFSFPMYKGRGFWQEWGQQETDDNTTDDVDGSSGATTGFWNVGDSLILKWSSVDRQSWDFWASIQYNNPAGPFGAPADVNSNVNGGLGVFSGSSSQYIYLLAEPQ